MHPKSNFHTLNYIWVKYHQVPNGIGALFGILQLILYATFYKSTKRMLSARKEEPELGLAVIPMHDAKA
ncbi:hypothetical protein HanPI659440_Chr03g0131001 [Helianthus annuus]|nr:hypothetical protein HanPI659440_Chr03g0131001 [Helianthus annuus]